MAGIMRINSCSVFLPSLLFSCFFCIGISHGAGDSLRVGKVMKDVNRQSLDSSSGVFRFLFFNPDLSSNRYLGIQYTDLSEKSVVWVANRDTPLNDTSGVLTLTQEGNLVITNDWGISITINSATSSKTFASATATLLDSGNLVLKDGEMHIIWQSFDYPTNTFLSGMKLGIALDLNTGRLRNRNLTSWLSPQVAVDGAFTLGVDPNNTKQLVIWQRGVVYWRSGIWNGYNFSNLFHLYNSHNYYYIQDFDFSYISNEKENYFNFTSRMNVSYPSWIQLNSTGLITLSVNQIYRSVKPCDYGSTEDWIYMGCVTPKPRKCRGGHVFVEVQGDMDYSEWDYLRNYSLGFSDCQELCMRNCSCNAFASFYDGTGCQFSANRKPDGESTGGSSFYVRNSRSKNGKPYSDSPIWGVISSSITYISHANGLLHLMSFYFINGFF